MKCLAKLLTVSIIMLAGAIQLSAQSFVATAASATIVTPITISQAASEGNATLAPVVNDAGDAGSTFRISGPLDYIYTVTLHGHQMATTEDETTSILNPLPSNNIETGSLLTGIQTIHVSNKLQHLPGEARVFNSSAPSLAVVVNYN